MKKSNNVNNKGDKYKTKERGPHTGKRTLALTLAGVLLVLAALFVTVGPGAKLLGTGGFFGEGGLFGPKVLHQGDLSLDDIPAYSGQGYIEINGGKASFTEDEITTEAYESYSDLDSLGRCGTAEACLGEELMPSGERDNISYIHPTGWHSDRYDFIEGGNLYNRSHLIAYSLAGENANEENLITGTRYMNADVMEPFESMTKWYIKDTGNHVMYRVTPIFEGKNLIASGVHMMALSVEDGGVGINYNVYLYNVQPGVEIDYKTGDNWLADSAAAADHPGGQDDSAEPQTGTSDAPATEDSSSAAADNSEVTYVLNTRSHKFHDPDCEGVANISAGNREDFAGTREELIEQGYEPCGSCKP